MYKQCAYPKCPELITTGAYCSKHQPKKNRNFYFNPAHSQAWRRASQTFLNEHPLCVECERNGMLIPSTEVDHIIPHKGNYELFWNKNNWQALCISCHSKKTIKEGAFKEGGGYINPQ